MSDAMPELDLATDGEQALAKLAPILGPLYQAFEHATEEARGHFLLKKLPFSGCAFSSLVRCHVHEYLSQEKYAGIGFKLLRLANDGIVIEFESCLIRVWKAGEGGELPASRASSAKAGHYSQPSLFPFGELGAPARKLVVLWDLDSEYGLSDLFLVCPKGDGDSWEPAEAYWTEMIQHPAETVSPEHDFGTSTEVIEGQESQTGTEGQ